MEDVLALANRYGRSGFNRKKGGHRVVVFGTVRADAKGHLVMTRSRVVLPTCCCRGRHCV